VLRAAKQYIYYIVTNSGPSGSPRFEIKRDNERMISVFNGINAINTCVARPKRVESCRGDAPSAAFFDEAAFMEEDFFNRFARPLLMVTLLARVWACLGLTQTKRSKNAGLRS